MCRRTCRTHLHTSSRQPVPRSTPFLAPFPSPLPTNLPNFRFPIPILTAPHIYVHISHRSLYLPATHAYANCTGWPCDPVWLWAYSQPSNPSTSAYAYRPWSLATTHTSCLVLFAYFSPFCRWSLPFPIVDCFCLLMFLHDKQKL